MYFIRYLLHLKLHGITCVSIITMKEFIVRPLQCGHEHRCITLSTRICAAEMAVRYAALSVCRKVHVCHCNSLGGAT